MKDNFSKQSAVYARFRPKYPDELYEFILAHVQERERVWDCATGNGQALLPLARHFQEAFGTDISEAQLSHGEFLRNTSLHVCPAHQTPFRDDYFDLITVAQALHWFGNEEFFAEVNRVLKPGGTFAAWGYGLLSIDGEIDPLIREFYVDIVGPYWDPERRHIDNQYTDIPFPFELRETPHFEYRKQWTVDQLEGYLSSWSSVQHFIKDKGESPVGPFMERVREVWGTTKKTVHFPIFLVMNK